MTTLLPARFYSPLCERERLSSPLSGLLFLLAFAASHCHIAAPISAFIAAPTHARRATQASRALRRSVLSGHALDRVDNSALFDDYRCERALLCFPTHDDGSPLLIATNPNARRPRFRPRQPRLRPRRRATLDGYSRCRRRLPARSALSVIYAWR